MNKKPSELIGNVEKFIDIMFSFMETRILVRDFYNQPFKPEMIKEYFEGWTRVDKSDPLDDIQNLQFRGFNDVYYLKLVADRIFFGWGTGAFIIKTLSDFISAVLNSGIKLKWK